MRSILIAAIMLCAAPCLATEPTVTELMKDRAHRNAWDSVVPKRPLTKWWAHYSRTGWGVTEPVRTISIDGKAYRLGIVSEPRNILGSWIIVIFAQGGKQAWGLMSVDGGTTVRWLGNPSQTQRAALSAARR